MTKTDQLTDGMKKALLAVGYGTRKYRGGYYSIEDPTERVDGRSLQALFNRGLINWASTGGNPQTIDLYCQLKMVGQSLKNLDGNRLCANI